MYSSIITLLRPVPCLDWVSSPVCVCLLHMKECLNLLWRFPSHFRASANFCHDSICIHSFKGPKRLNEIGQNVEAGDYTSEISSIIVFCNCIYWLAGSALYMTHVVWYLISLRANNLPQNSTFLASSAIDTSRFVSFLKTHTFCVHRIFDWAERPVL